MLSLEEYKKQVRECQRLYGYRSEAENERLMKLYENDFAEFLANGWSPNAARLAMEMGY